MKIADEQNLDLVEIAPTANPPVCRVIDYQKFLYAQKKKQKEAKANQKKQEVKDFRQRNFSLTSSAILSLTEAYPHSMCASEKHLLLSAYQA